MTLSDQSQIDFLSTPSLIRSEWKSSFFEIEFSRNKNLNIDIDAYYKELEGLTTFTNGFSNPLENLEEGESTIKGLDVLLKYRWSNYKIWAGYTFNDITFKFPNLQGNSKFPGNNDITHAFRISNTLKVDKWQFSLGWQIRSGKPTRSQYRIPWRKGTP